MTDPNLTSDKLPDVSPSEISTNAWMIYEMIRSTGDYKRGRIRMHDGKPGREWTGSMNKVVEALWPALSDRYLVEKEAAQELKLTLNRYLRNSRNLVCMRNGGVTAPSTWWVSDNWSPLTITHTDRVYVVNDPASGEGISDLSDLREVSSDVFNVQVLEPIRAETQATSQPLSDHREEEEMSEPTDESVSTQSYPCRMDGCTQGFDSGQGRASHERTHGIRVNADGTVTTFDPTQYRRTVTTGEVNRVLVDVIKEHPDGVKIGEAIELVMQVDPTITRTHVRDAITRLQDTAWNGHRITRVVTPIPNSQAHHTRYKLMTVKPTPRDVPPKVTPITHTPPVDTQHTAGSLLNQPVGSRGVEEHASNLRALLADLGRLARLEAGLAAYSEKNRELVEKLRAVTAERDDLRAKLDTLKSVFGSAFSD